MSYRVILTIILTGLAAILAALTFAFSSSSWSDLTLNLGSEVFGIALTVAIVDWMIERSKLREEAQRIAWAMLHDIDHAVWVWQGGRREFHLDELMALLDMVEDSDPVPPFTQNLFGNLGVRASDTLRLQQRVFRVHRGLKHAMTYLSGLGQIRELDRLMPPSFIVEALKSSIEQLARVTGQGLHPTSFGVARTFRDPTQKAQETRYRGVEVETLYGPAGLTTMMAPTVVSASHQKPTHEPEHERSRIERVPPKRGPVSAAPPAGVDGPARADGSAARTGPRPVARTDSRPAAEPSPRPDAGSRPEPRREDDPPRRDDGPITLDVDPDGEPW